MSVFFGKERVIGVNIVSKHGKSQSKTVTPSRQVQTVSPDSGFTGLESVTVEAIPNYLQDVRATTVTPEQMLSGAKAVGTNGTISGSIPTINQGTKVLDAATTQYIIPKGYHAGNEAVKINVTSKTIAPQRSSQKVVPDNGTVLGEVTISPIPAKYIDTTNSNATSADILSGKSAYVGGNKVNGSLIVQNYYTGAGVPDSSIGKDGDIYFKA